MTALWLGGTSSACTDAVMVTLVANTRGKPFFSICGIITEPIAEVSATAEPEMPLKNVVASTLTTDNPPRTRVTPTSTSAKATRRRAMPPSAMMAPASTKNGMVSIATLLTPSEIFSITASSGMPMEIAPAMAASASEYAIGTPITKQKNIVTRRTAMSMDTVRRSVRVWGQLGERIERSKQEAFDHEQQQASAANGDGQVGHADRQ